MFSNSSKFDAKKQNTDNFKSIGTFHKIITKTLKHCIIAAICKSWNWKSGNGIRGMMGMRESRWKCGESRWE